MIHISTSFALLVVAIIILVCIAGSRLSGRLGVPTLFIFIMLGMLFGSDGIFKIPFGNFALAEQVCSVALIFIMFYGGFGTRWSEAKPVAGRSILLSSVGVVLTALLTGLFCHLVLNMALMEGMLLGAVLGSTDAASVFSILRSRKLNLKYGTASMLELESGINDPFAYMMTVILLSAMTGSVSGGSAVLLLIRQLAFGLLTGATVAWLVTWLLKRYAFYGEGFDTIFVFAAAIISYALASQIGGNGYLSVYLTGIILGNQELKNQKALVGFFDADASVFPTGTSGISLADAVDRASGDRNRIVFNICGSSGGGWLAARAVETADRAVSGYFLGGSARCGVNRICDHGDA